MFLFPRELPSLLRHQGSPVCTLGCRHHCHLRVLLPIEVQDHLALKTQPCSQTRLFLHSLSACLSGGCFPHPLHPVPWFPVLPIRPHQPTRLYCYTSVAAVANPLAPPPTTLPGATDFRVHPQAICPPRPGAVLEQRATGRLGGIPHATATRQLGAPRVPRPPDGSGRPACPQHVVPQLLSLAPALRRPHAGAQCFASCQAVSGPCAQLTQPHDSHDVGSAPSGRRVLRGKCEQARTGLVRATGPAVPGAGPPAHPAVTKPASRRRETALTSRQSRLFPRLTFSGCRGPCGTRQSGGERGGHSAGRYPRASGSVVSARWTATCPLSDVVVL